MAPINLPDGSEVAEVILPDGASTSAVIAPDGSTVFSAIPDIQDDFNDGVISGWSKIVGDWSESDTHLISGNGEHKIVWDDAGQIGDESFRVRTFTTPDFNESNSNSNPQTRIFRQDNNNYYGITFGASASTSAGDFAVFKFVSGNGTKLTSQSNSLDQSLQYRVTVDYDAVDETIDAELFRVSDSTVISSLNASVDPQADFGTTTGNIGLGSFSNDAEDCRWDLIELNPI